MRRGPTVASPVRRDGADYPRRGRPELDELDQIGIELLGVFDVEMLDIALVTEILVVLRICGHVLRKPVDLQDPECSCQQDTPSTNGVCVRTV